MGQTRESVANRWRRHLLFAAKPTSQTHLARAIRLYGADAFVVEVIERVAVPELSTREMHWVSELGANRPETGFNMTPGGDANPMDVPELRARVSKALAGKPKPSIRGDNHHMRSRPECVAKVSAALKGKYVGELASGWGRRPSEQHIERLRQLHTGRAVSDETKAKLSAARAGVSWTDRQRSAVMAARAKSDAVAANNARLGAEAKARNTGQPITDAHRAAIRESNSKRTVSPETRAKIAESARRRLMAMSPEARLARAKKAADAAKAANTGKPLSAERKARISAARRADRREA